MPTKRHRFAEAISTGLVVTAAGIGITWHFVENRELKTRPLEDALWVCDWDVTKIYGPGSPEQASVVKQFRNGGLTNLKFAAPTLYRMGGSSSHDSREGILMVPFDPRHPETARALVAQKEP
ncbi:hypothetical protein HNR46_002063 [Haloferula luteola]|uniref:Uncharacterized protein n=1 Tax=Haloferula luteola TaxID=595692 RepID=A0A840V8A3_9BACT|nr:hypothetical protein [Haloferula luteola]MBB5351824.1 hypothetical protein [Haloferula luteola]